ncbi:MMPL family transporter [Pseudolysinimonas sp.]|uniref:MMPL family transporter n=1 Tax=Pseudolysinimonas sp. TaxID=2680009 RepID=UPI003F7E9827
MASLLDRLGRFSAAHKWRVLIAWLIALALAGGAFLAFGGSLASTFSIPGTETDRVTQQLDKNLSGVGGATGTVAFRSSEGSKLDTAQQDGIAALLKKVDTVKGVSATVDPFDTAATMAANEKKLSDGTAQVAAARAQLDAGQQQLDAAKAQASAAGAAGQAALAQIATQQQALDANRAKLEAQATQLDAGQRLLAASKELRMVSSDGSTALGIIQFHDTLFDMPASVKTAVADELRGARIPGVTVDWSSEIANSTDGIIGPGEITGVVIAAIVLIVMFGTLLPALFPLISSLIGVGVGVAGALAFSGVVDMTSVTPVLGVMLGLAVGIDYALFIINRHRRQLKQGTPLAESIGLANGTSGSAVVFAGATVLVALLALTVTGIPFLALMGVVGAACVLVAVLVAITLTPALLGMLGMRVLSKRARSRIGHPEHADATPKPMRTVRAVVTGLVAIIALLVVAIPALSIRLGLPDGSAEAQDTTQYRTYETVAKEFGAGRNGALLVTAQLPSAVAKDDLTAKEADLVGILMKQDHVAGVAPIGTNDARDFIAFQVVPTGGPSSVSTEQLVHHLRGVDLGSGVKVGVAGQASANIDISEKLASVLPIYLAVVVALSLVIMLIVFRSLLVPVMATAGFVLSFAAALGAMTAVYQWGWLGAVFGVHDPGPVLNFAPIIIVGVLFGLAMDYQLFLVSGMREAYAHGVPARAAVASGFRNARAVIVAAAIIMVSVFGGFVFSHLAAIKPLGFGLATGVLFDAFVVRMVLIPALMHLVGRAAWWLPRWLDRILPHVDIEGAALERTHPHPGAVHEPRTTVAKSAGIGTPVATEG